MSRQPYVPDDLYDDLITLEDMPPEIQNYLLIRESVIAETQRAMNRLIGVMSSHKTEIDKILSFPLTKKKINDFRYKKVNYVEAK
jgi:hypothetical protein